jgi:hypothetical protein
MKTKEQRAILRDNMRTKQILRLLAVAQVALLMATACEQPVDAPVLGAAEAVV